jgi:PI-3-kinase-related kinase SMG-1
METLKSILTNGKELLTLILSFEQVIQVADGSAKGEQELGDNSIHQPDKRQTRNTTALTILKQIKLKLEGRVGSKNSVNCLSIEDHVKHLIEEASDPSNLSLMFEGWMPWI